MAVADLRDLTLDALATVVLNERTLDLLGGHRNHIKAFMAEYEGETAKRFVGTGDMAVNSNDYGLDLPHSEFWKDTAGSDWEIAATGLGTFDEVINETASTAIVFDDARVTHWGYLANILEIGSGNNVLRLHWQSINATRYTRSVAWVPSRLGALKVYQLVTGRLFRARGQLDLNVEFETNAVTEVVPFNIHLAPHEMLNDAAPETYSTTAST